MCFVGEQGRGVVLGNPKSALIVEAPLVGIHQHRLPLKFCVLCMFFIYLHSVMFPLMKGKKEKKTLLNEGKSTINLQTDRQA